MRACEQRAIVCDSFSFYFDQSILCFGIRSLRFGFVHFFFACLLICSCIFIAVLCNMCSSFKLSNQFDSFNSFDLFIIFI